VDGLQAIDSAGNMSTTAVSFTLATGGPAIVIQTPAADLATTQNVSVTGQVTDTKAGVSSLQAQVDTGAFFAVSLDSAGFFSFATVLALDGSADGSHTIHLQARDSLSNMATASVAFRLDTRAPIVMILS